MRERKSTCNVLVLTARDTVEDRVHGFDLGADDYLTKPFSITEFEARVRALLRRPPLVQPITQICGLKIDEAAKRVEVAGKAVDLTPRECALEIFLRRLGRVMSKEQIAQHMNAIGDPLSANAIEVYVSRLRSKIEPSGCRFVGARLRLPVRGRGLIRQSDAAQSIRRRLLGLLAAGMFFVLATAGAVITWSASTAVNNAYDRMLLDPAIDISENVVIDGGRARLGLPQRALESLLFDQVDRLAFRVTASDGTLGRRLIFIAATCCDNRRCLGKHCVLRRGIRRQSDPTCHIP